MESPPSIERLSRYMVEHLNYHIDPGDMDIMLLKLEMIGVNVEHLGDHDLHAILHGKMAISRPVGTILADTLLVLRPHEKNEFLALCDLAHDQATRADFPVLPFDAAASEKNISYEEYLEKLASQRNQLVAEMVRNHYQEGDKVGHVVAELLKLEGLSAEGLADYLKQQLAGTEDYDGKSDISGGYLRSMATKPEQSRPRATVIDMLVKAYHLPRAEELMLHKMARGEDINLRQALDDSVQAGSRAQLVDTLIRYSGLSEPAITRLTGVPYPTISGWRMHNMTASSREAAEKFLEVTYHPELLTNTEEKAGYEANVNRMLSLMTDRPLGQTLGQLVEEAQKDPSPTAKMMGLLLGRNGFIELSEAMQMELLGVNRDLLYKMKSGQAPVNENHASRILDYLKCNDSTLRSEITTVLTGIEPPAKLFDKVRADKLSLTDMIRKVLDRKGYSITDAEKATGYTRLGPFLQSGNLKKHLYARRLAEFCGLEGNDAREFAVRAIHGALPTYTPLAVVSKVPDQMDEKQARRILVQLSGKDGHELAAETGVPHWIITDWIASGRSNKLQPVRGAFVRALGLKPDNAQTAVDDDSLGEKLLTLLGKKATDLSHVDMQQDSKEQRSAER